MAAYSHTSFDDYILNNNTTVIAQYTYDYDLAGNRSDMVDLSHNTTLYYYDSLNRLTTESRIGSNNYTRIYYYDSMGNRTTMKNGGSTIQYSYNNLNQLTATQPGHVTENDYSYDNNGNLVDRQGPGEADHESYFWDHENLMIEYTNDESGKTVKFLYDSLGKRIQRTQGTLNTRYFFDGINILMEKTGSVTSTVYTLSQGVIGQVISKRIASTGMDLFYHYDPIGNVLFVSDTSGNINTSYIQEGFGNVIATSGSANNNYHLTTKEIDSDTSLYYFFARWYDSAVGRFISKDLLHTINRYNFVRNNPVNFMDPFGLQDCPSPPPAPCPSNYSDDNPLEHPIIGGIEAGTGAILPEPAGSVIPFAGSFGPGFFGGTVCIIQVVHDRNDEFPDVFPDRMGIF